MKQGVFFGDLASRKFDAVYLGNIVLSLVQPRAVFYFFRHQPFLCGLRALDITKWDLGALLGSSFEASRGWCVSVVWACFVCAHARDAWISGTLASARLWNCLCTGMLCLATRQPENLSRIPSRRLQVNFLLPVP